MSRAPCFGSRFGRKFPLVIASFKRTRALLAACLVATCVSDSLAQTKVSGELTTCRAVRALDRAEADRNHPVRLKGVVTCYAPSGQLLFIQDETGGAYVSATPWPEKLEVGEVVEVAGVSGGGLYSPVVLRGTVTARGVKQEPRFRRISIEELRMGRFDSEFVEVEGVVRAQFEGGDHTKLSIASGGAEFTALLFAQAAKLTNLVDCRIRLRAVGGILFNHQKPTEFAVFGSEPNHVEVLRAAPADPFSMPVRSSGNLVWYAPGGENEHRIRLKGLVTFAKGRMLFLRDDGGDTAVQLTDDTAALPGDTVEVAGFVSDHLKNPRVDYALHRVTARDGNIEPRSVDPQEVLSPAHADQFLAVEGVCIGSRRTGADVLTLLILRPADVIAAHVFGIGIEAPQTMSRVRVSGIWAQGDEELEAGLWAQSGASLQVIGMAAAPVASGAGYAMPSALGAAAIGILGMIFAAVRLRGAKAQTEQSSARVRELERELRASLRDRERVARDLHDSTIQSVFALGLTLEDNLGRLTSEPQAAEAGLKRVVPEINRIIRDLRNMLVGLESSTIQPQEFKTALKSLALTLGGEQNSKIRLDIDPAAQQALNAVQATELMHVAREALMNSARHGSPHTMTVRLRAGDGKLRFTVEDDGRGFDPKSIQSSGFGLRNMAKRAENLGAAYRLESEPGKGTSVTLMFAAERGATEI